MWEEGECNHHSLRLIKTNDSRCRWKPGRGAAGRHVCAARSNSLQAPFILLKNLHSIASTPDTRSMQFWGGSDINANEMTM